MRIWSTLLLVAGMATTSAARADEAHHPACRSGPDAVIQAAESGGSDAHGYFARWFDRVRAAQASQPHWITPVATVTPRLEQEIRFDAGFQQLGNGTYIDNWGMGKGLELIPTETNEILINIPPYQDRTRKKPAEGFGDDPILVIKQRFSSANDQNGNYIVTGFLGLQAPTGITAFTNHAYVVTPTLAGGKGWGDFDIQATLGVALPLSHQSDIGVSEIGNAAFQYHASEALWPELELNATHWNSGPRAGKTQVFLTPGLILGRFPISGRAKLIVGAAYQVAVSPKVTATPVLTPTYSHQLIVTTRLTF